MKNLDLAEYFITSKAEKIISNDEQVKIEVKKADGKKCERCWKILEKNVIETNVQSHKMNAYNGFQNKKNEILKIKNIYFLFLIFFIFLIDRLSKNYIINNFNENIFYLNDF